MRYSFRLKKLKLVESRGELWNLPEGKVLINTINAHSYNQALKDAEFAESLSRCDALLPDGTSIVLACRFIRADYRPRHRCTGWDLFRFEMERLNGEVVSFKHEGAGAPKANAGGEVPYWKQRNPERCKPKVFFMGSSEKILSLIRENAAREFPNLEIDTYSPPFKPVFSSEDNEAILAAIHRSDPDLLWIGMTAPKQEKWAYSQWQNLDIHCHVGSIGAVFDFFAGTVPRAPMVMQRFGLEWLYRWSREPRRLFSRYGIGNPLFIWNMIRETFGL